MASAQQISNLAQLNGQEKAKIGVAVNEAKSFLANKPNAKASKQELATIVGAMKNDQERTIELLKTHSPKGEFEADPPKSIVGNGSGAFVIQGTVRDGDLQVVADPKGALIYGHNELNKLPKYGWLLAYSKPADGSILPNKVYVEAGHVGRLLNMGWSEIEQKLDASSTISRYWDSETGAAAVAEIQDQGNNLSFLGANFEMRP